MINLFTDEYKKEDLLKVKDVRVASRCIIKRENKYALLYINKIDHYGFPGGGLEVGETIKECAKREALEETGIEVNVLDFITTIREYYTIEQIWEFHYYYCEVISLDNERSLTQHEKELGIELKWFTKNEVIDILTNYQSGWIYGSNAHKQALIGFKEYLNKLNQDTIK